MKKTDNYSVQKDIPEYLKYLVKLRVKTSNLMHQYENGEVEKKEFEAHLTQLYSKYFSKFARRSDVEKPDWATEELLGVERPVQAKELNYEQCKSLYYLISQLQEKLGHTSIATQEWEDSENKGGKKTADQIEDKVSD